MVGHGILVPYGLQVVARIVVAPQSRQLAGVQLVDHLLVEWDLQRHVAPLRTGAADQLRGKGGLRNGEGG